MMPLLLLLATLAHGQASTDTISVPLIDSIQISNLGKDTRSLLSGRYTQTGKPTFQGGICFKDGTCQTTAPPASGLLRNFVSSMTTGVQTIVNILPYDDTIPQISEGDQVLVATMTPVNGYSNILIEGVINVVECTNNGNSPATVCLFRDTTAAAIACFFGMDTNGIGAYGGQVSYKFVTPATSTALRNYSVRVGYEAANGLCINKGQGNARMYGGVLTSTLFLSEIAP